MSNHDDLTKPNKKKSRLPGNSDSLFEQMENSKLNTGQFTKKFANDVVGPQPRGLSVEGESQGPIPLSMVGGSIQSADFMGNIQWTPAKKILTFLLTGGAYAAIIISIYLSGAKAVAMIFGGATMLIVLISYLLYWMVKG